MKFCVDNIVYACLLYICRDEILHTRVLRCAEYKWLPN